MLKGTFTNSSILLLTVTDQSFSPLCKYEGVDLHCNYDFNNWIKGFEGIFKHVITYDFLKNYALSGIKKVNNDIVALTKENKPQFLIWPSFYFEVLEHTFDTIRAMGTKVIGCFFDDIMRFDEFTIFYISHLDYIFTFDSNLILYKYKKFDVNPLILINPPSYNFFKQNNSPYKYNISFVGAKFKTREIIIQSLVHKGIDIAVFGRGWEKGYINTEQMIDIFNTSKINLNFVKTIDGNNTTQLKGRIFEICMCGGFLLTEYMNGIEDYFAIDKEIVCFHTIDEAIDKIQFYLKHDNIRKRIADAGHIKTRTNYSFEKIFGDIFITIKSGNIRPNYIHAFDIPDKAKKSRAYKHISIAKALYSEGRKDIWQDEYVLAVNFLTK